MPDTDDPQRFRNVGLVAKEKQASIVGALRRIVNMLTDRDLKQIMRSRDVPGAVSAHARRVLARRGKI